MQIQILKIMYLIAIKYNSNVFDPNPDMYMSFIHTITLTVIIIITSVYREKSIPMIALWCPAFSNHG